MSLKRVVERPEIGVDLLPSCRRKEPQALAGLDRGTRQDDAGRPAASRKRTPPPRRRRDRFAVPAGPRPKTSSKRRSARYRRPAPASARSPPLPGHDRAPASSRLSPLPPRASGSRLCPPKDGGIDDRGFQRLRLRAAALVLGQPIHRAPQGASRPWPNPRAVIATTLRGTRSRRRSSARCGRGGVMLAEQNRSRLLSPNSRGSDSRRVKPLPPDRSRIGGRARQAGGEADRIAAVTSTSTSRPSDRRVLRNTRLHVRACGRPAARRGGYDARRARRCGRRASAGLKALCPLAMGPAAARGVLLDRLGELPRQARRRGSRPRAVFEGIAWAKSDSLRPAARSLEIHLALTGKRR